MHKICVPHLQTSKRRIFTPLPQAAITLGQDMDLASGLRVEELAYAALLHTRDRLEGLAAFREKRMPLYTGE